MHARRKAILLWSGGKDSALALYHVGKSHPGLDVVKLVTCLSQAYDRVSMHGVRRQLIEEQAQALGLPVDFVVIPHQDHATCPMSHATPGTTFSPNDVYTTAMLAAWARHKAAGIEVVVFGDIFLEDLRAYREKNLARIGMTALFPIWKRDTRELIRTFRSANFRGIAVCIDSKVLDRSFAGRELDEAFFRDLPPQADPCGENGEFHTFVFDGPIFHAPVPVRAGEIIERDSFVFCDLLPMEEVSHK
jgi:uncharacterized protein (TIGR00290 family)